MKSLISSFLFFFFFFLQPFKVQCSAATSNATLRPYTLVYDAERKKRRHSLDAFMIFFILFVEGLKLKDGKKIFIYNVFGQKEKKE